MKMPFPTTVTIPLPDSVDEGGWVGSVVLVGEDGEVGATDVLVDAEMSTTHPVPEALGNASEGNLISSVSLKTLKYSRHPPIPTKVLPKKGSRLRDHSGPCSVIFGFVAVKYLEIVLREMKARAALDRRQRWLRGGDCVLFSGLGGLYSVKVRGREFQLFMVHCCVCFACNIRPVRPAKKGC